MDTPSVPDFIVFIIGFVATLFLSYMALGRIGEWCKEHFVVEDYVICAVIAMFSSLVYFCWDSIVLVFHLASIGAR